MSVPPIAIGGGWRHCVWVVCPSSRVHACIPKSLLA